MFWECGKLFTSEDGTRFDPETFSLASVLAASVAENKPDSAKFWSFNEAGFRGIANQFKARKGGWEDVVRDYSLRRLTKPEDKLPALSGLAHILGK
jgi:hypothetical protein